MSDVEKNTVTITCKFTKIKFEASSKRTQVHPDIAWWKQKANQKGWYLRFFEAIEYGVTQEFNTIEQFEEVLEKAQNNEPFEVVEQPEEPKTLRDVLAELTGEEIRASGSFLKKLTAIDTFLDSGYSLIGEFLNLDSTTLDLVDGIYLDCATGEKSNSDIRKQRKAYSVYTLFTMMGGKFTKIFWFGGRRLNECPQLKQLWEELTQLGLKDIAVEKQAEAMRLKAAKDSATKVVFKDDCVLGTVGEVIDYEGGQYEILYIESEHWTEDEDGISLPGYRKVGDAGAVILFEWTRNRHYLKSISTSVEQEISEDSNPIPLVEDY